MPPSWRFSATLALIGAMTAGSAQAHARLLSASPAPGGVVKASPAQIDLRFSEGVLVKLSGAAVTDGAGRAAPLGPPRAAPGDDRHLILPIKQPLPAGAYTVAWHAVAADTHRSAGQYNFSIR
jgi:methionine-rich copper-binding protein CopC